MFYFFGSLVGTILDSLWVESARLLKSKSFANFIRLSLTVFAVAVVVTALFGFITKIGGLK